MHIFSRLPDAPDELCTSFGLEQLSDAWLEGIVVVLSRIAVTSFGVDMIQFSQAVDTAVCCCSSPSAKSLEPPTALKASAKG